MGSKKQVEYEGKQYESVSDLAKEIGLSVNTVNYRLRKGIPIKGASLTKSQCGQLGKRKSPWALGPTVRIEDKTMVERWNKKDET